MFSVTYFYRDHRPGNFSIEELFNNIRTGLQGKIIDHSYQYNSERGRLNGIINARKHQGDINHITGDVNFLAIGLNPERTIITVHDLGYFENLKNQKLKQYIYRKLWLEIPFQRSKYITTVSHYTKSRILSNFNISESKIRVIHNPKNDLFVYTPKKLNKSLPRILAIGTGEHKNFRRLIEAVRGISCKLIFISRLTEELKSLLEKYRIEYESHFSIEQSQVINLYQTADILFFASLHEGFGMPIIEANSVGIPVITSNITSMPEVAGDAAYIVDPYHVPEIRTAVETLIEDSHLRNKLIENGIQNSKRFELNKIAGEYLSLYNELMS